MVLSEIVAMFCYCNNDGLYCLRINNYKDQ